MAAEPAARFPDLPDRRGRRSKPKEDFFAGKNNECRYDHFTMGGGKIDALMHCGKKDAGSDHAVWAGTCGPDSYQMQMATETREPRCRWRGRDADAKCASKRNAWGNAAQSRDEALARGHGAHRCSPQPRRRRRRRRCRLSPTRSPRPSRLAGLEGRSSSRRGRLHGALPRLPSAGTAWSSSAAATARSAPPPPRSPAPRRGSASCRSGRSITSRATSIPAELGAAAELIAAGTERRVDVAEMNGRIFINNSAIGLYPLMVLDRDLQRKRLGRSKRLAMIVASAADARPLPP